MFGLPVLSSRDDATKTISEIFSFFEKFTIKSYEKVGHSISHKTGFN